MSGGGRKNKLRVFPAYPSSEGLAGEIVVPEEEEK